MDETLAECAGGKLDEREREFRETVQNSFLDVLKSGAKPNFEQPDIDELWQEARAEYIPGSNEVHLDDFSFCRLLIELLEDSGVIGVSVTEEGRPGMSSGCRLLIDENPARVIDRALDLLRRHLELNDADGR